MKRKGSSPASAASAEVEGASMFPVLTEDAYQRAYDKNVVNAEPATRPDFAAGRYRHTHIHAHTHTHPYTYAHTTTRTHTHTNTHTHEHTDRQTEPTCL